MFAGALREIHTKLTMHRQKLCSLLSHAMFGINPVHVLMCQLAVLGDWFRALLVVRILIVLRGALAFPPQKWISATDNLPVN